MLLLRRRKKVAWKSWSARAEEPSWFHANEKFAEAVEAAAPLPILARSWLECYLEDEDRYIFNAEMWNFHEAEKYLRNLRHMQLETTRRTDDASATQQLASAICVMSDYIKSNDAIDEVTYSGGGETRLLEKCHDGDTLAVRLLLEAKAAVEHKDQQGQTPLHVALQRGHVGMVQALLEEVGAFSSMKEGALELRFCRPF